MSQTQYYYFPLSVGELQSIVEAHQTEFDEFLNDTFTEDELLQNEKYIDSIAVMYVQPILEELSFDDFYPNPSQEEKQKEFFNHCRSSISLENLPFLQGHPFQVTYLLMFLAKFSEVLIDRGGVSELAFKDDYVKELERYKTVVKVSQPTKIYRPPMGLDPIEALVTDVYKEIDRNRSLPNLDETRAMIFDQYPKMSRLFEALMKSKLDAGELLGASGLNPKDFGDALERLKFFLRKRATEQP
jgi:hypothetical protein